MPATIRDVTIKCGQCGSDLVRITHSKDDDRVYCLECRAAADFKEVAENGSGLAGGILTPKEVLNLRKQVRLARKNRN